MRSSFMFSLLASLIAGGLFTLQVTGTDLVSGTPKQEEKRTKALLRTFQQRRGQQEQNVLTGAFTLVRASLASNVQWSEVALGRFTNGDIIDLDVLESNTGYSIVIETTTNNFTAVDFIYDGSVKRTERSAPYALDGNSGNFYYDSSYISKSYLGPKSITVNAWFRTTLVSSFTYEFTIIQSSLTPDQIAPTTVPVPSPVPVPVPVPSPVPVPVPSPAPVPVPVPSPAPIPVPVPSPAPVPVPLPTIAAPVPISLAPPPIDQLNTRKWQITDYSSTSIEARHEACFVMVGRVAVLIGGRGTRRPDIYNPVTKTWKAGSLPPDGIELHHFQCVAIGNKVWIVGAWTGGFPREDIPTFMYIYDLSNDTWDTRSYSNLAEGRRRGGAALIAVDHLLYMAFGNRGGHETGDHAVSLPYLDVYNTITDTWEALPDATFPRDHVGGSLIGFDKSKFCIVAGRVGGDLGWPSVGATECYDIPSKTWSIEASIPVKRAGSAYGTSCDGKLLIAGGEGSGQAYKDFDAFDGKKWTKLPDLVQQRHGTGLAVDCKCNAIYIASGNGQAGGGMELTSMETITFTDTPCTA